MADLILTAALATAFTVDGTALVSKTKAFETEIGDVKQPDFQPQVKIKRFNNAANLSVRYLSDEPADVSFEGDRIVYRTKTRELRFYNIGGFDEGGVFEFDAQLFERPASNVLAFSLQTKGLEILPQPPLAHENPDGSTWEYAPWGGRRERPAHVNGSYAIYAKGLSGNAFKTGKLCHVYRPWAEDATGMRTWCDLKIDEPATRLTITIPQDFLETAIYPVLVDPTFGYTTHGASFDNCGGNCILFKANSTPASAGTLDSITVYGRYNVNTSGVQKLDPAIYSNTAGAPDARLAAVNTGGTQFTNTNSEITTAITYGSLGSGTQYWLGTKNDTGEHATLSDHGWMYDSSGGATELYYGNPGTSGISSDWPATTSGFSSDNTERGSIYATYTSASVTVAQTIGIFDQQLSGAFVGVQYQ